jgi:glycosyltransferase 2 family protein
VSGHGISVDGFRIRPVTRHITLFTLKIILVAGLYWLALWELDWHVLISRAKSVDTLMLSVASVLALVHIGIISERWRVVLRAIGLNLGLKRTFQIQYIANFFSDTTPDGFGGDVLRFWKARNQGLGTISAANSIMIDRTIGLFTLALVILGMGPLIVDRISNYGSAFEASLIIAVGIFGVFALFAVLERYTKGSEFPSTLKIIAGDVNALIRHPKLGWTAIGWSFLQHFNATAMILVLAVGLEIKVSLLDCITLIPLVLLVKEIPASILGWGYRGTVLVVAFGNVGVSEIDALALSLIYGLINLMIALSGGIVWLATRDVERPKVEETENRWLTGLHIFFGSTLLAVLHKTHAIPDIGYVASFAVIAVGYCMSSKFMAAIWQRVDGKGARIVAGLSAIPAYSVVVWGLAWMISRLI